MHRQSNQTVENKGQTRAVLFLKDRIKTETTDAAQFSAEKKSTRNFTLGLFSDVPSAASVSVITCIGLR